MARPLAGAPAEIRGAATIAVTMRLDLFLWFARLAPTRNAAQLMAGAGTLRIDGRRIDRAAAPVRVGQVLAYVTPAGRVRVLEVLALPRRRGPATEAALLYREHANPS